MTQPQYHQGGEAGHSRNGKFEWSWIGPISLSIGLPALLILFMFVSHQGREQVILQDKGGVHLKGLQQNLDSLQKQLQALQDEMRSFPATVKMAVSSEIEAHEPDDALEQVRTTLEKMQKELQQQLPKQVQAAEREGDPASYVKHEPEWVRKINQHEWRLYSQNGEDGIIAYIFNNIGFTDKYFVEFGTESGDQVNTRVLRESGWTGLYMDGGFENSAINLHKEFITPQNINQLFEKYSVPEEFDLLSIDVNYDDVFVWKAIDPKYRPRVVICEYNSGIPLDKRWVTDPADPLRWTATTYMGGSLLVFVDLAKKKGYSFVGCDKAGVNVFFVRDDILKAQNITPPTVQEAGKFQPLYHAPETNTSRKWVELNEEGEEVGRVFNDLREFAR